MQMLLGEGHTELLRLPDVAPVQRVRGDTVVSFTELYGLMPVKNLLVSLINPQRPGRLRLKLAGQQDSGTLQDT